MKSLLFSLALLASTTLFGQSISMKVENPQVYGNQVTFDVTVKDFTDIISMQYTLAYDTNKMTLVAIQNFAIESLNHGNFNDFGPGILLNAWFDPALEPVTLSDGSAIYQLVFDMVNNSYGEVCFVEDPLDIEFAGGIGIEILTFIIEDGCHPEPFPIILNSTGTTDLFDNLGLVVQPFTQDQKISFSLGTEQVLEFELFTLGGNRVERFEKYLYTKGANELDINTSLAGGIYMLLAKSGIESRMYKIISQ